MDLIAFAVVNILSTTIILNFAALDEELDLILHQETLPEEVLSSLGMDPDNMKVLTPQQLIEVIWKPRMITESVPEILDT